MKIFFPKPTGRVSKAYIALLTIVRATLIIGIVVALINREWLVVFIGFMTFFLSFLPFLFEQGFKIDLPLEFELFIVLFIYATLFLGEAHGYYTKFWGWDLIIHAGSAVAIGFVGFIVLYIMDKTSKIRARPITIAIFAFSFALAIGATWEIFEFSMDQLLGLNMQKSGLLDTMWDLIVNALGALFASIIGFIYLKTGEVGIFSRVIKRFEKDNPELFND